jgi:SAM-dependent methyltransferase
MTKGSPCIAFLWTIAAAVGLAACGESAAPQNPLLLSLADFDPKARRYLESHPILQPRLAAAAQPEEGFQATLETIWRETQRRVTGSMDYDLPVLMHYVIAPRVSWPLDPSRILSTEHVDYERVARFLAPGAEETAEFQQSELSRLFEFDVTGLRRKVLRSALERQGLEGVTQVEALRRLFEGVNQFLAEEQTRLRTGQESSAEHFLDWNLKTTTLSALPAKVGLVTDGLLKLLAQSGDLAAESVRQALVVGPGVDLANPHLGCHAGVAVYQPFEVLDALRQRGLSNLGNVRVDALDVNEDVLDVIRVPHNSLTSRYTLMPYQFSDSSVRPNSAVNTYNAQLYQGVPGVEFSDEEWVLSADVIHRGFEAMRQAWRDRLADIDGLDADEQAHLRRILERLEKDARVRYFEVYLPTTFRSHVQALSGDVVTHAFAADDTYDLVVCTNVLNYFPPLYRDLALLNLRRVTRPGGVLITTEDLGQATGEVWLGWRRIAEFQHLDWDPQVAYECVKNH